MQTVAWILLGSIFALAAVFIALVVVFTRRILHAQQKIIDRQERILGRFPAEWTNEHRMHPPK